MSFLYTIVATIIGKVGASIASIMINIFKERWVSAKQLKGRLNELSELEIASNAAVYIPADTFALYKAYSSKIQKLDSLVNSGEIKLSKKQTSKYKLLYKKVSDKLKIYRLAFILQSDISLEEQRLYYCQYIAPETTDIQRLISDLLNNQ